MQLTFLGTAGSWPTKERNASAVALDMDTEVVLLDCGEGTQRQFFLSPISFMRVRRILITHFHGDHFLGLPGLIQSMGLNNRTEPIDIYGPAEVERFVAAIMELGHFTKKFPVNAHPVEPGEEVDLGTYTVRAARAAHPVPALAFRIQEKDKRGRFDADRAHALGCRGRDFAHLERGETVTLGNGTVVTPAMVIGPPRPGRSVVYTGDTAPSPEIVRLAQQADVLIHEATVELSLEKEANEWGHSSARQAAQAAREAGVGELYLTHFSSRYPDVTPLENEAREHFERSVAAHDLFTTILHQR
ncbi:MAG: ribonuclease Z [Candidatus Thermoplasmatota archaeon]|jgi:ribonuclease Z|nr:ribonuclease Z [Candidatus Thermoplasmatota archaeon]